MLSQWVPVSGMAVGAWLKEVGAPVYGSGPYENGGF